jgi:lipooligosaccharide transport system ATP-binding protein
VASAPPIIHAEGVSRRYGNFLAVDRLDFEVAPGEVFGLLGPNGAGKTSTIRMIACVQDVSEGTLTVDGLDVRTNDRAVKALLGVVPQEDNLDEDLTVRQNLEVYARYFRVPKAAARERIAEGLALMQLEEKADESIRALSGGMKRRLVIARALVNEPRVLILDEPTTGLDPQARHLVWRKLRLLRERGVTILLTTHYMDEAENLCDRLIIMDNGRALAEGRPRDLILQYAGREVLELHLPPDENASVGARLTGLLGESGRVEEVEDVAYAYGVDESHYRLVEEVASDPYRVIFRRANLEDVFLTLTGRGLVE